MARTIHVLNDVQLRQWVRAAEPLAKADGDGLTFTLSVKGLAAWVLRFRHGGRRHELTLGRYPEMSLAAARKEAAVRRLEVQQGVNPATEKRKAQARRDWTVRALIRDYEGLVLPDLAESTRRSYSRNLKRVESNLGAQMVREVESSDIVGVIERYPVGWVESYNLLVVLKAIFRHAAGKKLINVNPCLGVELTALIGKRPEVRRRLMLTEAELHVVLNAAMSKENLLAVRVLAATGVRVSELYTARWEHVYLEEGRWHIPKTKTGPEMDIPLLPLVVGWLRELHVLACGSGYVLPARAQKRMEAAGGDNHLSKDALREAIDFWIETHEPEIRRFTPHDLRSTMKSHMRALGVSRDISEMCLNHKLAGVEGVYDVHTYYPERRAALELWAEFLSNCQAGKWKVAPLKKSA